MHVISTVEQCESNDFVALHDWCARCYCCCRTCGMFVYKICCRYAHKIQINLLSFHHNNRDFYASFSISTEHFKILFFPNLYNYFFRRITKSCKLWNIRKVDFQQNTQLIAHKPVSMQPRQSQQLLRLGKTKKRTRKIFA